MKSQVMGGRRIIECECGMPGHVLVVDVEDEDIGSGNFPTVEFSFLAQWRAPWWTRLWWAFKYVFAGTPYYISDTVIVNFKNVEQLEDTAAVIRAGLERVATNTVSGR